MKKAWHPEKNTSTARPERHDASKAAAAPDINPGEASKVVHDEETARREESSHGRGAAKVPNRGRRQVCYTSQVCCIVCVFHPKRARNGVRNNYT